MINTQLESMDKLYYGATGGLGGITLWIKTTFFTQKILLTTTIVTNDGINIPLERVLEVIIYGAIGTLTGLFIRWITKLITKEVKKLCNIK